MRILLAGGLLYDNSESADVRFSCMEVDDCMAINLIMGEMEYDGISV